MPTQRNNLGGIQKPSTPADFKKKREPVLLPSGQRIILKPTSLSAFLQTGSLPNSLMQVVKKAMGDKTGKKADEAAAGLMDDPKGLADLFEAMDQFVVAIAVEPAVHPVPEDESTRDDNLLYVDEIDLEDRMFIFTRAIGGSGEVQPFRAEPPSGVERVQPGKRVGGYDQASS